MNRSRRIALSGAAASTLIAGATAAIVAGPLGVLGPSAAQGPVSSPVGAAQPAAPGALDEALTRLTTEATALRAELAAARQRLDSAGATVPAAAATPRATSAPAPSFRRPAPVVHARTGASSAAGHAEKEFEDD